MGPWLFMLEPATLVLEGAQPVATQLALASGWNLIGFPGAARPTEEALGCLGEDLELAANLDGVTWRSYSPGFPLNDLTQMGPGKGYWLRMEAAGTLGLAAMNMQAAVTRLLGEVDIAASDPIIAPVCPLFPGEQVVSKAPAAVETLSLNVTQPSLFFFIDDAPGDRFAHPTRYALLGLDNGDVTVRDSQWWPGVMRGDELLSPFREVRETTIQDHTVGLTRIAPPPSHPVTESAEIEISLAGQPPSPTGRKEAIVIDGGAENWYWWLGGDLADDFAADADKMQAALEARGFTVTRFSNYWGNSYPALKGPDQLDDAVQGLNLQPGDEFFFYVSAHAHDFGFGLYAKDGSGKELDSPAWMNIGLTLRQHAPHGVKVTSFADGCYSGPANSAIQRSIPNHEFNGYTATDADHSTPGGQLGESFTESVVRRWTSDKTFDQAFDEAKQSSDRNPQKLNQPYKPLAPTVVPPGGAKISASTPALRANPSIATNVAIAGDNSSEDNLVVAFSTSETYNPPTNFNLLGVSASTNGGASWQQLNVVNTGVPFYGPPTLMLAPNGKLLLFSTGIRDNRVQPSLWDLAVEAAFKIGTLKYLNGPTIAFGLSTFNPSAAIDGDGNVVTCWTGRDAQGVESVYSSKAVFINNELWDFTDPTNLGRGDHCDVSDVAGAAALIYTTTDTTNGTFDINFRTSNDGGATWQPPVFAGVAQPLPGSPEQCGTTNRRTVGGDSGNEVTPKPSMAADPTDANNLYISWTRFGVGEDSTDIAYSFSHDGGRTWSVTTVIGGEPDSEQWLPNMGVGENGTIVVTYYNARQPTMLLRGAISYDGGSTFETLDISDPFPTPDNNPRPYAPFSDCYFNSYNDIENGPNGDPYIAWADSRDVFNAFLDVIENP